MLVNLVVNARDAINGSGNITIGLSEETVEGTADVRGLVKGQYAVLTIRDDGCGIPEANLPRLFEPFFTTKTADNATSGQVGTGLGLATRHGILCQSGGGIAVDSIEGEGTTVVLHIPLAESSNQPAATLTDAETAATKSKSFRVLLVEDNDLVLTSTVSILEHMGHQVICERTAESALMRLQAQSDAFDLLIADVELPGISGQDLVNALPEALSGLPVLHISGYTDRSTSENRGDGRQTAFLQKPYRSQSLKKAIAELMGEESGGQ